MDFELSDRTLALCERLGAFMDAHVYPNEEAWAEHLKTASDPWATPPLMQDLKQRAR